MDACGKLEVIIFYRFHFQIFIDKFCYLLRKNIFIAILSDAVSVFLLLILVQVCFATLTSKFFIQI